ncbi:MAG: DMT family transporter [Pseudomonadota bacterium]|nr:DMT family transporter [Pseudomonadota bacterium]
MTAPTPASLAGAPSARAARAAAALLMVGTGWGAATVAVKVAVSTGHAVGGLMFWHFALFCLFLLVAQAIRRRPLPLTPRAIGFYVGVAALGNFLPALSELHAAAHLPAGVLGLVIAMTPIFALLLALILRVERPEARRLVGVGLGALAIVLLLGPEAALPDPHAWPWVVVLLATPLCYAAEGLFVALLMPRDMDPVSALLGAALCGFAVIAPYVALTPGTWVPLPGPFGPAEIAMIAGAALSCLCYLGYLRMNRAFGPVYASLVSYLVTISAVLWSVLLLGERHSGWLWAALAAMIAGMALVQPRR